MTEAPTSGAAYADKFERRAAVAALKERLGEDHADTDAREELVAIYRSLGSIDQVGRFAIGLPEGARPHELAAYRRMLYALGADQARARQLSLVNPDAPLPMELADAFRSKRRREPGWLDHFERVVLLAWYVAACVFIVALLIVFTHAIRGDTDLQRFALYVALLASCMFLLTFFLTLIWRIARRRLVSSVVFGVLCVGAGLVIAACGAALSA